MIFKLKRNFLKSKPPVFTCVLVFLFIFSGCAAQPSSDITAVASTTLIGSILEEVGGDHIEAATILPGGMCPGHFDLKPSDMKAFSGADMVLYQGWEPWINDLLKSGQAQIHDKVNILAEGNLMVPPVHIRAVGEISGILKEKDPGNAEAYESNARRYVEEIQRTKKEILSRAKEWQGIKVVSSHHQEDLLGWMGLEVVETYKRSDNMSPGDWQRVIGGAKESGASAVIDNLQSGPSDGKIISGEAGIPQTYISNFPLDNTYLLTLKNNFVKVKEVLK